MTIFVQSLRQVAAEHGIVGPPLAHGASGHEEEVLDLVAQRADLPLGIGGVADIVKAVLPAAVGEDRDVGLRAQEPRGEEHGVRAAGDVHRAAGVALDDGAQQREHGVGVVDVRLEEDELYLLAAAAEVFPELFLDLGAAGHELRADVHDPPRPEHLHAEDVFQGPLVKQLDQGLHAASLLFSRFSYCTARTPKKQSSLLKNRRRLCYDRIIAQTLKTGSWEVPCPDSLLLAAKPEDAGADCDFPPCKFSESPGFDPGFDILL